jgi:hypothetical protein
MVLIGRPRTFVEASGVVPRSTRVGLLMPVLVLVLLVPLVLLQLPLLPLPLPLLLVQHRDSSQDGVHVAILILQQNKGALCIFVSDITQEDGSIE